MDPNDIQEVDQTTIDDHSEDTEAGRKYLSLLPPRFLGYSTQEKFWGQFKVSSTSKVSDARASMFKKQLQLDETYKEMIQALVYSHESKNSKKGDRPQVRDVVEDKGKGLVILLHGEYIVQLVERSKTDMTSQVLQVLAKLQVFKFLI